MPPCSWRSRGLIAVLVCALTVCGTTALAPTSAAAVPPPVATPTAPMANEQVRFTGATPTRVRRAVTIQRRAGTGWVRVGSGTTTAQGRYTILGRLPASTSVRAFAPRVTVNGRRYAAWTSAARVVRIAAQTVALTVPATAETGTAMAASAIARPVRPGRTVRLQALVGDTWTTVASDTEDAAGATSWSVMPAAGPTASYRAVAVAWKGAVARISPVRTVTVTDPPAPGGTELVSVALDGGPANNHSGVPRVSGDGRWVVFASHASNLVAGDTEGKGDVFLRDLQTGTTVRVSQTPAGVGGDQTSWNPDVSDDGRFVTYRSSASNLGWNGGNKNDVLLWDRTTGTTTPVSLPFDPEELATLQGATDGPYISGDGSTVVWVSDDADLAVDDEDTSRDAYAWDRVSGVTTWISHGQETSPGSYAGSSVHVNQVGSPSDDGTEVPFVTSAIFVSGVNPGPGCCTTEPDVYVWNDFGDEDVVTLATRNGGNEARTDSDRPAMSGDGNRVVFVSGEENFASAPSDARPDVFVPNDENGYVQVSTPATADPATRGSSDHPEISDGGSVVVFESIDEGLVLGQPDNNLRDVFRWVNGTVELLSQDVDGGAPNAQCGSPDISGDGSTVVFQSAATDLVPGDTGSWVDIYVVADLG